MDISINATVFCADSECGKTIRVIIDPIKKKLTHIIVRERGIAGLEKLVSVDEILKSTINEIHLSCTYNEFAYLENFVEYEYIPGNENLLEFEQEHYFMHPYSMPDFEDDYSYAPL
jgi:hypothetical protein